jgi:hypothetical protein
VTTYVIALLATILIEFPILWLLTRKPVLNVLLCSVLINCFTQPLATWAYQTKLPNLWLVEAIVVAVESVLIFLLLKVRYSRALLASLLANAASALLGVVWFGFRT